LSTTLVIFDENCGTFEEEWKLIPRCHPQNFLIGLKEIVAPLEEKKNPMSSMTLGQFSPKKKIKELYINCF
jgi:hypothetical protein